jgi:hypothetical protein
VPQDLPPSLLLQMTCSWYLHLVAFKQNPKAEKLIFIGGAKAVYIVGLIFMLTTVQHHLSGVDYINEVKLNKNSRLLA